MADIQIHQIYYKTEQRLHLDPLFSPYDNAGVNDPILEYGVIRKLHKAGQNAKLWGAMSWKFNQKTKISGQRLFDYIEAHSGFDIYYCNPNPEIEAIFQNMWMHGNTTHPGFLGLVRDVFAHVGLETQQLVSMQPSAAYSTANFIVATSDFWESYTRFMDRITGAALAEPNLRDRLLSADADPKGVHAGACYLPFLVERLFGVFLESQEGQAFKACKYHLPEVESKLSQHHRRLREMKDVAWTTRSVWLADCWMQYRNLFLNSGRGAEWSRAHLPDLTPSKIQFSSFPQTVAHAY
jgi:hypothetical protein